MNTAHVNASFYLLFNTGLTQEEFELKFNKDILINSQVSVTLPDGSVHIADFADLLELNLVDFEEQEKATENCAPSDQIVV